MKKLQGIKNLTASVLAFAVLLTPLAAMAQTRITLAKNKYSVQDDVKLGQQASAEAERQLPVLRDATATDYVERVGERLVDAIPTEFDQPAFRYTFKIINANDINAFALPGGPMYLNRGMIQAARNEGEMAGVMAHEISHVALRHATAQQTKLSSPTNQILGIGAILGGAILGGQTGAAIGSTIAQGYFTRYSRDYETQADILGAQIMARAGYDPRDLANMFQTIQRQSGGSGTPEFLSSHPNPANRYQRINQEAALLRVSNPVRDTGEFQRIKSRLSGMPRAQSNGEIARNGGGQRYPEDTRAGGGYATRVEYPSTRYRTYNANVVSISAPDNWQSNSSESSLMLAPAGAYGQDGITHGALIGAFQSQSRNSDLRTGTQEYVSDLLRDQGNSYLRQSGSYVRGTLDGREAISTTLSGRSPITGRNELVTIYTTELRNGAILYVATVTPQNEAGTYNRVFNQMIRSLRIND